MINLYTTEARWHNIQEISDKEYQLKDLVVFKDLLKENPKNASDSLIINSTGIVLPLDWVGLRPPYLLPETLMFDEQVLMGMVHFGYADYDKAYAILRNHTSLMAELQFIEKVMNGEPIDPGQLAVETYQPYDDYRLMHNCAIVRHYGMEFTEDSISKISYYYKEAIATAPNEELAAFSTHHYFIFLFDLGEYEQAFEMLEQVQKKGLSKDAKIALQNDHCTLIIQSLRPPYDQDALTQLKDMLWDCIVYYEKTDQKASLGLALYDAAYIANISDSFAESLGYYTRGIQIFDHEGMAEFVHDGHLKKGNLLFTWAQKGNPQFYKSAMESYQLATKMYTKDQFPLVYAEIQEQLGVIYSEIPDEVKKKSIWAAVSSSCFLEALSLFTKESFPYEYARVCNHYGNALTKYPEAIHSDNYEKALYFYQEALTVRTAEDYPMERSLTLLNYLESCWYADNSGNEYNQDRLQDMDQKIKEIIDLNCDTQLVLDAQKHLEKLHELKRVLKEEMNS